MFNATPNEVNPRRRPWPQIAQHIWNYRHSSLQNVTMLRIRRGARVRAETHQPPLRPRPEVAAAASAISELAKEGYALPAMKSAWRKLFDVEAFPKCVSRIMKEIRVTARL
jgi:hypothetical protein